MPGKPPCWEDLIPPSFTLLPSLLFALDTYSGVLELLVGGIVGDLKDLVFKEIPPTF